MQTFANNAYGFLASGVSAAATTLVLGTGEGARFPTTSGDNFKITLIALTNGQETAWEIVNVTARSSDTLTVQRAQEGTTALVWPSLTRVELRLTAGATESKANLGTAAYTASTAYAPAAQGVTNGDSHDHSGGDGGQIAYSGLSGLPTLGTAAAKNIPASGNASATEVVYGSDTRLHVAATVADTNSINLTLTGQQISADAIFGTTSTTVAAGDHTHSSLYQPLDTDLTAIAGLSSADSNFIVGSATGWVVENGATVRTSLGLGTAATAASTDFAPIAHVGAGGTAHANVVAAGAAGFMTGADKTKLDGIASGANTGTVTSVGLSLPAEFTVSNSPVTTSGTLTAVKASQTANTFFAAPNGSAGAPTFRALVAADVPQTLPNMILTDPAITGTVLEDVFTITDGAAFEIDPGNGSIQLLALGASRTPKATNFAAGESVTLMVLDGSAYTLTWTDTTFGTSGVTWVGGTAPTLDVTKYTVIELWKIAGQVYGALVGAA